MIDLDHVIFLLKNRRPPAMDFCGVYVNVCYMCAKSS